MESKRGVMLMMVVMMMGSFLAQTEAQISIMPLLQCLPPCLVGCENDLTFPNILICPFNCLKTCLSPSPSPSPSPDQPPSPDSPSPSSSPDSPSPSPFPDSPSPSPSHDSPSPSSSSSPSPSAYESFLDVNEKIIEESDAFCKLSCAEHHCASLSTFRNPNVEKVTACIDSCSKKCSNKN